MTAHPNGQWSKKYDRKVYYFGPWDDWRAAEKDYLWRWPFISAGHDDPKEVQQQAPAPESCTLERVVNLYLASRKEQRDARKITPSHYADMRTALTWLLDTLSWRQRVIAALTPGEWGKLAAALEDGYGPDARKRMIGLYRSVSKWGAENGHCPAWSFGDSLPIPARSDIRAARRASDRQHGEKLFPREQLKAIYDECPCQLDAMFLLALNCGFTAADLGQLDERALDLDHCWFDYDRVKTGVYRAGFLWPVTVKALRQTLASRPAVSMVRWLEALREWESWKPKGREALKRWEAARPSWDTLVFRTRFGQPWWRESITVDDSGRDNASCTDSIGYEFGKVLKACDARYPAGMGGMAFKRGRVGFATGRHTYFSAARWIDLEAATFLMGHADESMGSWYSHLDDDKLLRLQQLADTLHDRLSPTSQAKAGGAAGLRFRPLRLGAVAAKVSS